MSSVFKGIKEYFKQAGTNNPVDKLGDYVREQLERIGMLDIYDEFIYWNGWRTFRVMWKTLFKFPIEGKGNFPEYGPALVVSNHQSEYDPFLVGCAVQRKVQWLSKKENFEMPIFRTIIKPFGTIPLERGKSDKDALAKVDAVLQGGGCVGMFPEGTRSADGSISKFRKGAALIAMKNMVLYVPCAIIGAYKALPKGTTVFKTKPSPIKIRIGKPVFIDPTIEITAENLELIAEDMQRRIVALHDGKEIPPQSRIKIDEATGELTGFYYPAAEELVADDLAIS